MSVLPDFTLRTPRLLLRAFTPQDAQRVFEIRSDFEVTRMLVFPTYPPVLEHVAAWLSEYAIEWRAGTAYRFAVVADGRVIGSAEVDEIQDGCGELGYWLERDYWGRGLASEAAGAVHDFATRTLGLRRLVAGHAADNPPRAGSFCGSVSVTSRTAPACTARAAQRWCAASTCSTPTVREPKS